jgi:hypothetical protein
VLYIVMGSYIPAAPLPPAPRQPMRSQDRGEREMRKPRRALDLLSALNNTFEQWTYTGVGLPKVFRRSPLTAFCGDR